MLKGVGLATDTVAVCPVGVAAEVQQGALVGLAVTDVEPMFAPSVSSLCAGAARRWRSMRLGCWGGWSGGGRHFAVAP
ncbi:MAG: hypothetical protein IPJ18_09555 [Betaproteobacteria bacterium]|nr:hypothetical protein [Betaproteobacteria bacterium]